MEGVRRSAFREFALPGEEATISRDRQGRLIVEAVQKPSLVELLRSWTPLPKADTMPAIEGLPAEPFDL
jgi:hypothetical protein